MTVHLFGIRHHGPGCARSLAQALHDLQPDCVLIEGPPDADELIGMVADSGLAPPVALLIHVPGAAAEARRAVYYPFAAFSPEWQAMRHAVERGVPVRFCDLPQSLRLAEQETPDSTEGEEPQEVREDPLRWLANAAGYSDTDTWWEHLVEQRGDSLDLFAAIAEMMTVVRTELAPPASGLEARREAWMRQTIRQAQKQGYERIAVVCGAYHVPALANLPSAKSDADLLKGLPKVKVAATWTPWSFGRLAYRSGYGAGIAAPGWYQHLWLHPDKAALHFLTNVAALLRRHDLDASSAHIIEAARLADALAALRHRPRAGLAELQEAVRAVFCYDSDTPLRLIEEELLICDRLGTVPESAPMLPLPQDVAALQKRLRMPVRLDPTQLELDLREAAHREKSLVLHRLALLGVQWGRHQQVSGKSGTFNEVWHLAWQPEFALRLIEANIWGATLESAATASAVGKAAELDELPALTELARDTLLADLREAIPALMRRIGDVSALTPDLGYMLAALAPLVQVMRYGSVRETDTSALGQVVDGLIARACVALPPGVCALADEAAASLLGQLIDADRAIRLLQDEAHNATWFEALAQAARSGATHALIGGRCARILTEQHQWDSEEAARQLGLQCSPSRPPLACAHWLEGFLQGSGALLIHDDKLWQLISAWLASLAPDAFMSVLPLLRRTFGSFAAPERRQLGERATRKSGTHLARAAAGADIDTTRAAKVLPVLAAIVGVQSAPLAESRP